MRWQMYLKEVKRLKLYIISTLAVICLSYSVYLFFDDKTIRRLTQEDGFFEYLTPVFFVFGAVFLFLSFRRSRNIFLLGLAVLLLIGAGEEISWGQRIFSFDTPRWLHKENVQDEFNIHNIDTFNDRNFAGRKKTGWQRLAEINMLFRIFSVIFLVCVPLFFSHMKPLLVANKKRQMPVAPLTIGIFFIVSWAISYGLKYFILPRGKVEYFYLSTGEIFEFTAAYIYFIVALYFYTSKNDSFLGKVMATKGSKCVVYHVSPNASADRWVVSQENGTFRMAFGTKQEAEEVAKLKAKMEKLAQVKVHKKDGNMDYESTYGEDPRDIPG